MSVNLIKILGLKVQVCFNKNTYMGFNLLLQGLSEVNTCPPVKINDDAYKSSLRVNKLLSRESINNERD